MKKRWPMWLVWFVFMCLVAGMFWCIGFLRENGTAPWWVQLLFAGMVAGILALPHVPRGKDEP